MVEFVSGENFLIQPLLLLFGVDEDHILHELLFGQFHRTVQSVQHFVGHFVLLLFGFLCITIIIFQFLKPFIAFLN